MKNNSLVIMAGGASSRMKRSLFRADLDAEVLAAAENWHKSLIPLDKYKKPLLYFLLKNAVQAEIENIYLITSDDNQPFHSFLDTFRNDQVIKSLRIKLAVQQVPKNRTKPFGTADALQQCIEQYPELLEQRFTVCNADNLYSQNVIRLLKQERKTANATIAYQGSGLGFDEERLLKFAVMDIDENGFLRQIIEKPSWELMNQYRDDSGELAISMNIFNVTGGEVYPFLKKCPVNPVRDEKELPEVVRMMVADNTTSFLCYKVVETLPDLTTADDIKKMNSYL